MIERLSYNEPGDDECCTSCTVQWSHWSVADQSEHSTVGTVCSSSNHSIQLPGIGWTDRSQDLRPRTRNPHSQQHSG